MVLLILFRLTETRGTRHEMLSVAPVTRNVQNAFLRVSGSAAQSSYDANPWPVPDKILPRIASSVPYAPRRLGNMAFGVSLQLRLRSTRVRQ